MKFITVATIFVLMLGLFSVAAFAATATANPTASTVLVNDSEVAFDAYNILDNNYFKLRDLAYTLNGTAKQFEVGWDGANNAISLTSGQAYTVAGGEMTGKGGGAKEAAPTDSRIYLDWREVSFTAYNIDGNNYFKLRDIGEAFDFGVDWDGDRNTIVIDTGKGYSLDGGAAATPAQPEPPGPPVTTEPPTTEPEQLGLPEQTEQPAIPPGGEISAEIVGPWRGALDGFSYYFMFRDDGTFSFLLQRPHDTQFATLDNAFALTKGNWYLSEDTIYMTDCMGLYWPGSTPPDDKAWEKIDDGFLKIRIYEKDEAKQYNLPYRYIEILNIVSESPSIKGATLNVRNENLPSWAYLGD